MFHEKLFEGSKKWRPGNIVRDLIKFEGNKRGLDFDIGDKNADILTGDALSENIIDQIDVVVDDALFGEQRGIDQKNAEYAQYLADERKTMEGYWDNYQTWSKDAKGRFDRDTGSMKARMAASGLKSGTEQWDTNLAKITDDYANEVDGFSKGVTGTALSKWAKGSQGSSKKPLGMNDYLSQEFGTQEDDTDTSMASPW